MYLSVCGSELLRDGRVTACAEGPCQADVPSCRSSYAALVCVSGWGGVLSAGGLLPAPFVHLCDSHTGFTDLHVAVSHWQPSNDQKVTFSRFSDPRTSGAVTGQDNGFLPLSPTETVYVAESHFPSWLHSSFEPRLLCSRRDSVKTAKRTSHLEGVPG